MIRLGTIAGPALSGTYETPAEKRRLDMLRVYVDESGDRNFGPNRQSNWFTMTAVVIPFERDNEMRFVVAGARAAFGLRSDAMLHWKDHLRARQPERRDFLVGKLSEIENLTVIHVALHKPSIDQYAHIRDSQNGAYNYVTRLLLERVAHTANRWPTGSRLAHVKIGVVGGVDHDYTERYLNHVACRPDPGRRSTPWDHLSWPLQWAQAANWDGLQVADVYSGMLHSALNYDEGAYLARCRHQHLHSPGKNAGILHYGLKLYPDAAVHEVRKRPWWDPVVCGT